MKGLIISQTISDKLLYKHNVVRIEVEECFLNRTKGLLEDTRSNNVTNPPTQWFISGTNKGRQLKVVFVVNNNKIYLKTAYEPSQLEVDIYDKHA